MIRRHLTFANCVSMLALFIALGGTSYAVATNSIGTRQIKNNSVRSSDVRNGSLKSADVARGSLGGRAIKESSLGWVPGASRVGGKTAAQLKVHCPAGTQMHMGACIELLPRQPAAYGIARVTCELGNRRLPAADELAGFTDSASGASQLAPGGELTEQVLPPAEAGKPGLAITLDSPTGGDIGVTPNTYDGRRAYRCVATPLN